MRNIFVHSSFEAFYEKYPLTLIDVGVSGGISKRWRCAEKYLQVVGFEPDKRAFNDLSHEVSDKQKFINTALHSSEDTIKMYMTKKQECSSIFPPDKHFLAQFPEVQRFEVVDSINLKVERLSSELLNNKGVNNADFLKVDTQGGELFILQGAQDLLINNLFGIEVEVEFVPIYINQPLFCDVDKLLQGAGYQLFDLKRYYWKRTVGMGIGKVKGQIIFADALYFKTYESFFKSMDKLGHEQKKAKIFKAISVCLIYGIYDYALYICDRAYNDNLLTSLENEIIFKSVSGKKGVVNFRGKGTLANIFYRIYKKLKTGYFYFTDEELGDG